METQIDFVVEIFFQFIIIVQFFFFLIFFIQIEMVSPIIVTTSILCKVFLLNYNDMRIEAVSRTT
jgi:hypothetical protein